LRLAGANNLHIALATQRVRQARARLDAAEYLWLPSLNLGVAYNYHTGRL
jgi:outer membrane protein TolC